MKAFFTANQLMQLFVVYAKQYQISEDGCESTKNILWHSYHLWPDHYYPLGPELIFYVCFFEILEIAIRRSLTY